VAVMKDGRVLQVGCPQRALRAAAHALRRRLRGDQQSPRRSGARAAAGRAPVSSRPASGASRPGPMPPPSPTAASSPFAPRTSPSRGEIPPPRRPRRHRQSRERPRVLRLVSRQYAALRRGDRRRARAQGRYSRPVASRSHGRWARP
jgi:hypothetical protein